MDGIPAIALLKSCLPTVLKLPDYIFHINNGRVPGHILLKDDDPPIYRALIQTAYVGSEQGLSLSEKSITVEPLKEHPSMEPPSIGDIIRRSQQQLLRSRSSNLLTRGYKLTSNGVENEFVNTLVTALNSHEWRILFQRIGIQAMSHLLTSTFLFLTLPNGNLCQITGKPLYDTLKGHLKNAVADPMSDSTLLGKRKSMHGPPGEERLSKRLRIRLGTPQAAARESGTVNRRPAQVFLIRQRVLYSRPSFLHGTGGIAVGLSPHHILNRIRASLQKYLDPDPQILKKESRHLAKYIFPRQYGLPNAFSFFRLSEREAYKVPDFMNREEDIKKLSSLKGNDNAKTRTPKRLKQVLVMLDKLVWRHKKCKYKLLQDRTCPSKIKGPESRLDSEIVLETISQSKLLTQMPESTGESFDTDGNSISRMGLTQAALETKRKPQFAEFCCPHEEVYRFVVAVVRSVIPKAFWGSDSNFKQICKHIKTFITARRYDKISLHHVLQDFSTASCDWLMPLGDGSKQRSVPVTDALKRRELLEDFMFWFFDSFVISLIRTTFYVTESSAFRNRLLYFRHDDWNQLCAPLLKDLIKDKFEKINDEEASAMLQQRKLGFSFIRLLPKDLGVRPIVNLRRKQSSTLSGEYSINTLLQAALQILTYEKENQPNRIGAACFSVDNHYTKLKEFKLRLPRLPNGSLPKLYFFKVDVQACFDTILQEKLLEILREIISEESYMIQRYSQISQVMSKPKTMFRKRAWPDWDHPHFLKYATDLANALRHTIFVDQVACQVETRAELLDLLEQHITENIVKIGDSYYRQTVGIPQGSTLSTILCSFFYGDMEKRFGHFMTDIHSLLLRNVDDYLFITTQLNKAHKFLALMNKGHPEYGCFVSKGKTLTNFDYDEQIMNVIGPKEGSFPWCGYSINMKDLSVSNDYTRYYGSDLRDSLTVDRGYRSGIEFRRKMLVLAKTRSHIIYTDPQLNSETVIIVNVYQNFLIAALKMQRYLHHWDIKAKKNKSFIHETVRQMCSYCFASIRNKTLNKVARESNASISLKKGDVLWLGMHAFHTILSRKETHYSSLLRYLSFELSLPKNKSRSRRFRSIVKEAFTIFLPIVSTT